MLKIQRSIISQVRAATTAFDLHEHLQKAIQLEHSTIPPYLTALYSIKKGTNIEIAHILRSVLIEEMLHMAIAANTLNAIGGEPRINTPAFIPTYPGPLPMNIGDGLQVGLEPLSLELLQKVFMRIEEPENPIDFPIKAAVALDAGPEYATIGEFYQAILDKIQELGERIFIGHPARQVVNPRWFPLTELFPVRNPEEATRALTLIVEQGEGTSVSPLARPNGRELAHYYRFSEIVNGRRLKPDPHEAKGFSYSGEPLHLDTAGIWNLLPNARATSFPENTQARFYADQFNATYTRLLTALHETFNGRPEWLDRCMGIMYELRLVADKLVSLQAEPDSPYQAAPPFEYSPAST